MAVQQARLPGGVVSIDQTDAMWHVAWFAAVSAVAFLVPLTFSSGLGLNHDLYLFIYFAVTLTALAAYLSASGTDLASYLSTRWQWSLAVGAVASAFVVWSVIARLDSTPHPDGAYFIFEI